MLQTVIPQGYAPCLNLYDTQKAIGLLKRLFEDTLGGALHLRRVSAPLFVEASTGLNDDLNGVERAVSFDIPDAGRDAQVVHSTQELEELWPDRSPKEREDAWVKEHPVTFLMGIGGALKSGRPHDGRAPDYDDWTLNGDILVWNPVLERAFELSSMGIRVDAAALDRQLTLAGCEARRELPFHKLLLEGKLPLTIGGGIGQSRLCMLLLGKAHIGEVQASVWDEQTIQACRDAGVILL